MAQSYLDAKNYGVGELITQRKLFAVPEFQRDFSWTSDVVEQYLDDISTALAKQSTGYFIGMIVITGPLDGVWQILDGQQRLTTTIMIYAAIRDWLAARGFDQDARQIDSEFIGVRQLGGAPTPRLKLNRDNAKIFDEYVVRSTVDSELEGEKRKWPRGSSNRLLIEAAHSCIEWIEHFAIKAGEERNSQSKALFSLASYIETNVKVVCVDVSSSADAYVLFESLNDRGQDLSALDLVKNYIFSYSGDENKVFFQTRWEALSTNIEPRDADDFLKIFWTSRFGIIQKSDLFGKIREKHPDLESVKHLIEELVDASIKLDAIEDHEHELWNAFPVTVREKIRDLSILGSRQVRSVILSALSRFNHSDMDVLLRILIVLIVRYQLVGRERTGILEKALGRLSQGIWERKINGKGGVIDCIGGIIPDDSSFRLKFTEHSETKAARAMYLLLQLEESFRKAGNFRPINGDNITSRDLLANAVIARIDDRQILTEELKILYLLGNQVLIEKTLAANLQLRPIEDKAPIFGESEFHLTSSAMEDNEFYEFDIKVRSSNLAAIAVKTWFIEWD